jgi:corticotropin releasing hormone receptor 1
LDSSDNATRVCQPNGTWANYSNYRSCVPLSSDFGGATPEYGVGISEDTTTIYFTGYTVSIVALTLAIWIFIHFKLVISSIFFCFFVLPPFLKYYYYYYYLVKHNSPPVCTVDAFEFLQQQQQQLAQMFFVLVFWL